MTFFFVFFGDNYIFIVNGGACEVVHIDERLI